jgi:hypothetical protein
VYWIVHALDLLDEMPEKDILDRCVDTLSECPKERKAAAVCVKVQVLHAIVFCV